MIGRLRFAASRSRSSVTSPAAFNTRMEPRSLAVARPVEQHHLAELGADVADSPAA